MAGPLSRLFRDRLDAGAQLAARLRQFAAVPGAMILALPRGGVPVGAQVARTLGLPLDVFVVRKLGVPGEPELAMGAIASGGVRVLNEEILDTLHVPPRVIEDVAAREARELRRREKLYRGGRPSPDFTRRTVLLVDDGIATGSTVRAAIRALRKLRVGRVVVATPVVARGTLAMLQSEADEVVTVLAPHDFAGVGQWYENFDQTTDEEVRALLAESEPGPRPGPVD